MTANTIKPEEAPSAKPILDILNACYKPDILKTAIELEIWSIIARGQNSAEDIAQTEGWDITGTRVLLDVLCGMQLLGKTAGKYHQVPVSEAYLVPDKATYMGDYVLLELGWEGFGQLSQTIRSGKRPINDEWTGDEFSKIWVRRFAPRRIAPLRGIDKYRALWRKLDIKPTDGLRVLDVACGTGIRILALATQHPGVQVTLQELPIVLDVASELAENLGVKEQVTFLPGDLREVDLGQDKFDLVFMSHIAHFFGHDEIVALFKKLYSALSSGGELVIAEVIADEERREAESALLAAIWLYSVSAEGDMFTFSELRSLLDGVGFVGVTLICDASEDFVKARKS
jgi:SAM-dependent methyltransferase